MEIHEIQSIHIQIEICKKTFFFVQIKRSLVLRSKNKGDNFLLLCLLPHLVPPFGTSHCSSLGSFHKTVEGSYIFHFFPNIQNNKW